MKIIICGDIVPTKSNADLFILANGEQLVGHNLKHILDESNFTIANLETSLVDNFTPIKKSGRAFALLRRQ